MTQKNVTAAELGAKGGKATAEAMTPEQLSDRGKRAIEARWAAKLPAATHEGVLMIGDMEIPCAVLANGKRVLTQSGFMLALGRARQAKGREYYDGDVNLPAFLTAKNLKPFISDDLTVTSSQIEFRSMNGVRAFGYEADLLPKVCNVFLRANTAGALNHTQEHIAEQALILVQGLALTGIRALVDEATGFQYDRPRRDLQEQLKKFLSEKLTRWVSAFPPDYFKHLCRLRGIELRDDMRLPKYFGHLTNSLVYRRIAPGLLKALKNRREERGKQSNKLYWWTSGDVGYPALLVHVGTVVGLMKVHTDYAAFEKQLNQIAAVYPADPGLFDDPADWEEPKV